MSLFPPTYDNTPNGLRIDLMQKIAALHPGYLRVPGGNYLEGATINTYFNWKNTIGPIEDRPGHYNSAWGYWSQDGMGLLEYLEMAEEVGAQPHPGRVRRLHAERHRRARRASSNPTPGRTGRDPVRDRPDRRTYWGAMRAADGHPAPFNLNYGRDRQRGLLRHLGQLQRLPLSRCSTTRSRPPIRSSRSSQRRTSPAGPPDVIDDHYYSNDPSAIAADAHTVRHDQPQRARRSSSASTPSTQGTPTGTLADALGEAAFLTGLERDADVVIGASYAPLLVNVNAPSWPTNLIGYNGLTSYGSPSYYAQTMFADALGDQVAPSQIVGGNGNLWAVASTKAGGTTYLTVVNRGANAARVGVSLSGVSAVQGGTATVLTGDPAAQNTITDPTAVTPATSQLGPLGRSFTYKFPANSLTVLALATG